MPWVKMSNKWTCSEWGVTIHTFECMCMSFPPKEHDITKALHGDMGSDMAVMWVAKHDIIIKGV